MVEAAPEADAVEGFASVSLDAADEEAELDVLQGAQMEDEPRLLRDERDLPPADVGRVRARERSQLPLVHDHLARRLSLEPGEQVQQRRLAAAGAAHDRGEGARIEFPGETVEHRRGPLPGIA